MCIRVLQQRAKHLVLASVFGAAENEFEAKPGGAGLEHGDGLRKTACIDKKRIVVHLGAAPRHGHRFSRRRGFVEQRSVADFHAGQVNHHLLEVDQRFQAALRNFRLVRRVGGVPAGVFKQVAQDHGRCVRAVIAQADKGFFDAVVTGDGAQFGERGVLGQGRGQIQRLTAADVFRHGLVDQRRQGIRADDAEHLLYFSVIRPEVAGDEFVLVFEFGQRAGQYLGDGLHNGCGR